MKQSEFHKAREGLNDAVVADRIEEYGTNFIKISVPPILYLVVHEVRIVQHRESCRLSATYDLWLKAES